MLKRVNRGECRGDYVQDTATGGYDVVLHCRADPALSLAEAHQLVDELEKRQEVQVPEISQALVHVEPEKGSSAK